MLDMVQKKTVQKVQMVYGIVQILMNVLTTLSTSVITSMVTVKITLDPTHAHVILAGKPLLVMMNLVLRQLILSAKIKMNAQVKAMVITVLLTETLAVSIPMDHSIVFASKVQSKSMLTESLQLHQQRDHVEITMNVAMTTMLLLTTVMLSVQVVIMLFAMNSPILPWTVIPANA